MGMPAARTMDKVTHPLPGQLMPGPGSFNVLIGNMPAWRGLPAAAAAALQAAQAVADAALQVVSAATKAAMGTPAAPAAIAAETAARQAASSALGAMMQGMGAACAALGGMPDTHICATPLPPPVPHGPGMVIDGSPTVLTNGLPQCAVGDKVLEALGGTDPILMGCFSVMVGKSASGGGGGSGGIMDALKAAIASLIAKALDVIDKVVDTVQKFVAFVNNLVKAVIAGLANFVARFGEHLINGVVKALADLAKKVADAAKGAPPKGGNPGPVFDTQDEAARAALEAANPQSIKDNLEYGGMIYKDKNGKYGYTGPAKGTDAGFNPTDAPIPPGTTAAGDYHTHGDYSTIDPVTKKAVRTSDPTKDDYNSDNFSQTDKNGITNDAKGNPGYKGYLGTPSGKFKQFDPATGKVSDF